jgi:hypothetical protein
MSIFSLSLSFLVVGRGYFLILESLSVSQHIEPTIPIFKILMVWLRINYFNFGSQPFSDGLRQRKSFANRIIEISLKITQLVELDQALTEVYIIFLVDA